MDYGSDSNKGFDFKVLMGISFAVVVGIMCNIVACLLWHDWWPFFVVVAYFFAPLPNIFFGRCATDPLDTSGRNYKDIGYFLTGVFVISGFGLPAVLAHVGIITIGALILAVVGGVIVYASLLFYVHKFHPTDPTGL